MSNRKDTKALIQWNEETRQWATAAGRQLALDLYYGRDTASRPYGVGVVLDAGEMVLAEVPVRFNLDPKAPGNAGHVEQPDIRTWLVTSARLVGRLSDGRLHGYRWERAVGARVTLTPGNEALSVDVEGEPTLVWSGAAVAPMAVAAIFFLFGAPAVVEHPGLAQLSIQRESSHVAQC